MSRPTICAATKPGTEAGAMPAKVPVKARPTVTAGFAKLVDGGGADGGFAVHPVVTGVAGNHRRRAHRDT